MSLATDDDTDMTIGGVRVYLVDESAKEYALFSEELDGWLNK